MERQHFEFQIDWISVFRQKQRHSPFTLIFTTLLRPGPMLFDAEHRQQPASSSRASTKVSEPFSQTCRCGLLTIGLKSFGELPSAFVHLHNRKINQVDYRRSLKLLIGKAFVKNQFHLRYSWKWVAFRLAIYRDRLASHHRILAGRLNKPSRLNCVLRE